MPPKKKSRSRKQPVSTGPGHRIKLLVSSLFLLAFLLACLIILAEMRESMRPPPPPSFPPPVASTLMEDVRVELESALLRSGVALAQLEIERSGDVVFYEVEGDLPPEHLLRELARRLTRIAADVRCEALSGEGELRVSRGSVLLYRLRFHRPKVVKPARRKPRVAIIMDDLGRDLETARALIAIDLPITFAILPGEANASRVADIAKRGGREIMIHIPMEPQSYPATNPGADALLVAQSPEEIRRRFQGFRAQLPDAIGGNNHMGSRFTENREKMAVVLAEMKEAGLFFVDSRTSGNSVAFAEARRVGIPAAGRDIFLDNEQDVEKIVREIRKLAILADRRGQAVGICHPHPETLEALRRELPYLKAQHIEVVPVAELLER